MWVAGCSSGISSEQLAGTYLAKYTFGDEHLVLKSDGTFTQDFVIRKGPPISGMSGRWRYEQSDNALELTTNIDATDGFCRRASELRSGPASFAPEREFLMWGRLHLGTGDNGCDLEKVA